MMKEKRGGILSNPIQYAPEEGRRAAQPDQVLQREEGQRRVVDQVQAGPHVADRARVQGAGLFIQEEADQEDQRGDHDDGEGDDREDLEWKMLGKLFLAIFSLLTLAAVEDSGYSSKFHNILLIRST